MDPILKANQIQQEAACALPLGSEQRPKVYVNVDVGSWFRASGYLVSQIEVTNAMCGKRVREHAYTDAVSHA